MAWERFLTWLWWNSSDDKNVAKNSTVATAGCNGPSLEGAEKVRDISADEEPVDWQLAGSQIWGRQELKALEMHPAIWIWASRLGQGSNTEEFPPSFPLQPSQVSSGDVPAWPAATAQPRALPETKTSSRALEAAWDPSSGLLWAQAPGSSGSVCEINPGRSSCGSVAYLAGGKDTLQAGSQKQARAFCNQLYLQQHLHMALSPSCSEFQVSLRNGHTPQELHASACSPCYMHRMHPSSKAKSNQLLKMEFKLRNKANYCTILHQCTHWNN